jgi:CheY-like chemotaxis protein
VASILVVDDEFGIGEVISAILEDDGHSVLLAMNGRQALDTLAEESVDLVLTDYMMPMLDGPGLLRAMAEDERLRDIPVVMMSSLPEAQVARVLRGGVGFLRKPFRVGEVSACIEEQLRKSGRPPRA